MDVSIQYCSDIHLEDEKDASNWSVLFQRILKPSAPILCLMGDIGDPFSQIYNAFMEYCSLHFKKVFIVAGNHEFFGCVSIDTTLDQLRKVTKSYGNISFLHKSFEFYEGLLFLGTTLWSFIPEGEPQEDAKMRMNDYKYIQPLKDHGPMLSNEWHVDQRMWLEGMVEQCCVLGIENVIVMTHHPPSMKGTSLKKYDMDPLRWCYRNNMDHLLEKRNIRIWFCGHTHVSFMYHRGKGHETILAANQFRSYGHFHARCIPLQVGSSKARLHY